MEKYSYTMVVLNTLGGESRILGWMKSFTVESEVCRSSAYGQVGRAFPIAGRYTVSGV